MADGDITLTLSREAFEGAKGFVAALSKAMDAAEAEVKAQEKAVGAEEAFGELVPDQGGAGLGNFGQELSNVSNSGIGLPPV